MIYIIKNIMSIAIDMPYWLDKKNISLKNILTKIFPVKKDIAENLGYNLKQSKKIYSELLNNIIDTIQNKADESENNWEEPNFTFTDNNQRICFGFDDDIIKNTLMKCEFLKSWNELDKSKIEKWIKFMVKEDIYNKPYLEFDNVNWKIIVKQKMKLWGGTYIETPAWRRSFLN
jgi:predicted nucleic acid-binding protein